ncbi:Rieske (2Fe-2S) protein [Panacibacter ginsenosidivorans]|uniref:Rieske (2Fe-2S) protein n=1 Tax=Panacibacter ginsenosidivorans TaxID=1813871 RepID=A0A5B8V9B2_9BACT|nr:Rieske (2Fe-2S) protein [Panacibacter ginsenosidivorans]QEC67829.1 Rieske (2Fe-2S) protein [Panacibacter ginsenosidivorans]
MDRKQFLSEMGFSAAGLLMISCLGGCSKSSATPAASKDFTVDLNAGSSAALGSPGGYIYTNGVIVAQTLAGKFIAVSQSCTHEGVTVTYDGTADHFYCPAHGSVFNDSGKVINGPANNPLQEYTVDVNGSSLHIHV